MADETIDSAAAALERARLVRLCARLTGDPDVAEDLAQETLLEAWRHAHKLHNPAGRDRWLAAIARNVALRWHRSRARIAAPLAPVDAAAELADPFDIESTWERRERGERLGRALALLPPPTRTILVERYVHELPHAAIAARHGVSEDAVAMRLSRAKLHLRRILTTETEQAPDDAPTAASAAWEPTRIWCPACGRQRFVARLPRASGTVTFRCPACTPDPAGAYAEYPLMNTSFAQLLGGLSRPTAVLSRTAAWAHTYFRQALAARAIGCTHCGRTVEVRVAPTTDLDAIQHNPTLLAITCEACGASVCSSFDGLTVSIPDVHRFWRAHGRIRTLPPYEVEIAGQAAVVTRIESLTSPAQLDVIALRDAQQLPTIYEIVQSPGR